MAGKIYLFARFTTVQFLNEHAVLRRRKWEEMKGREREWLERKEVVRKGVWKKLVGVSKGGRREVREEIVQVDIKGEGRRE